MPTALTPRMPAQTSAMVPRHMVHGQIGVLDRLRRVARDGRVLAANARLDNPVARLLQALVPALGATPRFFRPGSQDRSFDETWLMAVFDALDRADAASYRFLLQARMSRERASSLHFVLRPAHAALQGTKAA